MTAWKSKNIVDSYTKTTEFRFNNYVVNPHVKNIVGCAEGKALLDVGCGFGRYLEMFSGDNPSKLVGCDLSDHQIELCRKNIKNGNLKLYVLDFTESSSSLILGEDEYDVVFNVFVVFYIDKLDKLQKFIENSYKCLKKGGKFLICSLDFACASFHPEVLDILKFPTKPLTEDNKFVDGCPVEIRIREDCIVTSYQRDFNTLKKLMEAAGFKDVKKCDLFLDKIALQAFNEKELNTIKKSNILLFVEAHK